jgi:hypothetical protein
MKASSGKQHRQRCPSSLVSLVRFPWVGGARRLGGRWVGRGALEGMAGMGPGIWGMSDLGDMSVWWVKRGEDPLG